MIFNVKNFVNQNKVVMSGALFSLFSFINKGLIFLLLLVLANYIGPTEYGYLSFFSTLLTVLGFVIALCSEGYLSFSYFREGDYGIRESCSSSSYITLLLGFVLFFLTIVFGDFFEKILHLDKVITCCGILISMFTIYFNLHLNILRVKEEIGHYGLLSVLNAVLNFLLSVILVSSLCLGWKGRVYANLICCLGFGFFSLHFLFKKKYLCAPSRLYLKKVLLWSLPLIPHSAVTFIRQGLDRYIVEYNYDMTDVGLFSFAMNMANIIVMIGIGFNQPNSVDISKVLGNNSMTGKEKVQALKLQRHKLLMVYLVSSLIIMISVYFFVPVFMPKYTGANNMFIILSIQGFLCCFYFLYTNYLFFYSRTKEIMYVTFGSSIFHLIMSLFLTPYSIYLTCLVYVLSQSFICISIYIMAKKELKKQLLNKELCYERDYI